MGGWFFDNTKILAESYTTHFQLLILLLGVFGNSQLAVLVIFSLDSLLVLNSVEYLIIKRDSELPGDIDLLKHLLVKFILTIELNFKGLNVLC